MHLVVDVVFSVPSPHEKLVEPEFADVKLASNIERAECFKERNVHQKLHGMHL